MKEERVLALLDFAVRKNGISTLIDASITRLEKKLIENPNELFVWETIPVSHFSGLLPSDVNSCCVFLIRSGMPPEKHRHPNSRQRTLAWRGSGDLQTAKGNRWISNVLVTDPAAELRKRWVSIPTNTWHRPIVTSDWAVVSFHNVNEQDLVEEAGEDQRKRKYVTRTSKI